MEVFFDSFEPQSKQNWMGQKKVNPHAQCSRMAPKWKEMVPVHFVYMFLVEMRYNMTYKFDLEYLT